MKIEEVHRQILLLLFTFTPVRRMRLANTALALVGLLTLASNLNKVESVDVDVTSCIQQNWIQCGISLGTTVFHLHSWSDDVPYKVNMPPL